MVYCERYHHCLHKQTARNKFLMNKNVNIVRKEYSMLSKFEVEYIETQREEKNVSIKCFKVDGVYRKRLNTHFCCYFETIPPVIVKCEVFSIDLNIRYTAEPEQSEKCV